MKTNEPKPDKNQAFLFINKNQKSKSLSRSDGAIAKQINRHAQQVRNRKTEDQKLNAARTESSSARRIALTGWRRREDYQTAVSPQSPSPKEDSSTSSPAQDGSSTAPESPNSSDSATTLEVELSRTTQDRGKLSTEVLEAYEQYLVDGERDDDGGCDIVLPSEINRSYFSNYGPTPFVITEQIHAILQNVLQVYPYSGNNFKLALLPPHISSTIAQFPIGAVVQRSVYKEHHAYSIAAAHSARLKHNYGLGAMVDDPKVLYLKASRHVQQELIQSSQTGIIDKQTILDILFLCVSEMARGQYKRARLHLLIVGKLYHLLDLNNYFDRWISESAAHVDNQLALSTHSHPVLSSRFDPGPMLPERMAVLRREAQRLRSVPSPLSLVVPSSPSKVQDIILDLPQTLDVRMGSQLRYGLKMHAFSPRLGAIVSDIVDCIEIAKVVWLSPLAVCFDAEWLCRKARATMRALLRLAPENNIGPNDIVTKCLENCRLCLLILMTHACTLIGRQTAASNMKRLKQSFTDALEFWCPAVRWTVDCVPLDQGIGLSPYLQMQAGFVLWGLMTGVWVSEDLPEEDWFRHRASNICRTLGYSTYEDLHHHMSQYLYSKSLQESSLSKTAKKLQSTLSTENTTPPGVVSVA